MIKSFKAASMVLLPVVLMSAATLSHSAESKSCKDDSRNPRTMCTTSTMYFTKGDTVYYTASSVGTHYVNPTGEETTTEGSDAEIRITVNGTTYWGKKIYMRNDNGQKSGFFSAPRSGHLKVKIISDRDTSYTLKETDVYIKISKTPL